MRNCWLFVLYVCVMFARCREDTDARYVTVYSRWRQRGKKNGALLTKTKENPEARALSALSWPTDQGKNVKLMNQNKTLETKKIWNPLKPGVQRVMSAARIL